MSISLSDADVEAESTRMSLLCGPFKNAKKGPLKQSITNIAPNPPSTCNLQAADL